MWIPVILLALVIDCLVFVYFLLYFIVDGHIHNYNQKVKLSNFEQMAAYDKSTGGFFHFLMPVSVQR